MASARNHDTQVGINGDDQLGERKAKNNQDNPLNLDHQEERITQLHGYGEIEGKK